MNPLVTVITAFGRGEYSYLREAGESLLPLAACRRGDRSGVQWLIAVNGNADLAVTAATVADLGLAVAFTHTPPPARGPGPARTQALAHATGRWVFTLDADDRARADGVAALVEAAEQHGVMWAAGQCDDLVDGQVVPWTGDDPFAAGIIPASAFWQFKLRTGAIPFLLNGTVVRTDLLRAVGGWPLVPMPRSEDTAVWAVLTAANPGVWVPTVASEYRKHAASMTGTPGFRQIPEDLEAIQAMVDAGSTQLTYPS